MRAINHDCLLLPLLTEGLLGSLNTLLVEVGALCPATQDNEAMLIALGAGDSGKTLLCHTHEVMFRSRGTNCVDRNSQIAICTVLEAHGERQARSQLAVQLRLCGSRSDRTNRDTVRQKLGADGIQHLARNWHPTARQIDKHLPADPQSLIDLETLVDVRVVDQTLPSDSRARLLEVSAHDDAQVVGQLVRQLLKTLAVLEGGGRIVNGAWAYNDEEAVGVAGDDFGGFDAAADNSFDGILW